MLEIRKEFKAAHPDIAEKLSSDEYRFLFENEHLGNNICLLGLGGSHAYGLNTEGSDVDIRGVATLRKEEILGTQNFEQFENKATDTVIYGIKKFFSLLAACNPNIVELVGLRDCDYIYISPIGQMILDNKDLFLSKRAASSFGGYAQAQLKRIKMLQMNGELPRIDKQEYTSASMNSSIFNLCSNKDLFKHGSFEVKVNPETEELVVDTYLDDMPLSALIDMLNTLKAVKQDYEKSVGHTNNKNTEKKLNKHMMHLVRLYRMGIEILGQGKVNTYRANDHDLLMSIRNVECKTEQDVEYFYNKVENLDRQLINLKNTSTLQKGPDMKAIEDLLIKINEYILQ